MTTMLADFTVQKPADVSVAVRKARVLAALANVEKSRRTRLGKAVTETCRSALALGGHATVNYTVSSSAGQAAIEIVVGWMARINHDSDTSPAATSGDAPDMAVRRVGELLDEFSLDNWPGPGGTATLKIFLSAQLQLSDNDIADWSAMLGESQLEEVIRRGEQRRRQLDSDLHSAMRQEELLDETGTEASEAGLVTMLSLVASKTDNGVAILDADAGIVWVNEAFANQCGFTPDECQDTHLVELLKHRDSDPAAVEELHDALQTGRSRYVELLIHHSSGQSCWAGINLTPVFDADDSIERWIVLLRDITQQRQSQDALTAARDAAEQASRAKSEFLANMSHEIRTPMNAIIGMTELALSSDLTDDQHEYLSTVRMSAESLLELLNDILDLSKIEAGKVELDEVDFDLADIVRDTLKPLAVKAHSKGLELATRLPMSLPQFLHGDPLRIRQVLINLVGNAIKFTEEGEVVVEFELDADESGVGRNKRSAVPADDSGPNPSDSSYTLDAGTAHGLFRPTVLNFTVSDTGIGIPADRLERIFESFTQVDASTTRQFGGTGLGLTITAELLRIMGGSIQVESEVGVGSSFRVSIPLRLTDDQSQPFSERIEFSREQLEGRTVLVIDDNATNRRILEEMLTSWGLRPRMADGADAAFRELEAAEYHGRPFDLLLIDAMMPDSDGFEVIEAIRQRSDIHADTVMMLSSADRTDSARRCRDLGIGRYLVKPVSQSALFESIVAICSDDDTVRRTSESVVFSAARDGLGSPSYTGTLTVQQADELALVPLSVLIADDHAANRSLAARILEKRGHRPSHAANGQEVLDLLQNESFDLILMDVQMPELDGLQATAAIRVQEEAAGTHTPIVALTAHAMKGDRERCLAGGMDAYLSKPLRAADLITLVEKLCEPITAARIGTSAARTESETHAEEADDDRPVSVSSESDFSGALDRMDGDVDLLSEQMRFFLDDAPVLLSQIEHAAAAVDCNQLQSAAHRLKGLVSSYDQTAAADVCLQLEFAGRDGDCDGATELVTRLRPQIDSLQTAIRDFIADHT